MSKVHVTWRDDGGADVYCDGVLLVLPPEVAPVVIPLLKPKPPRRPWHESFEAGMIVGCLGATIGWIAGRL